MMREHGEKVICFDNPTHKVPKYEGYCGLFSGFYGRSNDLALDPPKDSTGWFMP
jgi:hypothetical protein